VPILVAALIQQRPCLISQLHFIKWRGSKITPMYRLGDRIGC
jgi:hypothetical protein